MSRFTTVLFIKYIICTYWIHGNDGVLYIKLHNKKCMKFRITDTMRLSLQKPSTLASKFWPFMNFITLKLLIVMLQMFVPQQLNDPATFLCKAIDHW